MLKKALGTAVLVGLGLAAAKSLLNDQIDETADEVDLGVVAAQRRYQLRGRPLIASHLLAVTSDVELDLRQAEPSPTGIEVNVIVVASRIKVICPPEWAVASEFEPDPAPEPVLRIRGSAYLGSVQVETRPDPITA